jgi:phosphatidylglycerol:prolipoprotein diacylglycerol transferase
MLDSHFRPDDFGILPNIFGFSSYALFVGLGITLGLSYYLLDARTRNVKGEGVIEIVSSGLIFGLIGSKIPLILEGGDLESIIFGKSIVGGLVGGMIGVLLVKRILSIKLRMGNIIAPAVALGMAVGRIGCFLNGCCYGVECAFGFDFGDGLTRFPAQLAESSFHFIAFIILHRLRKRDMRPGILFKWYVISYFIFRFLIEFARVNERIWFGLTVYQLVSLAGIVFVVGRMMVEQRKGVETYGK